MRSRKIAADMISRMSKESLKANRMRNIFVMITIVLASSLLTAIFMFAIGQDQREKKALSHSQQAGYYNLTKEQVEILKKDSRIAYQVQVKTGILSELDGFDIMPSYVSGLSDEIQVGELEMGRLPETDTEIAVQSGMLEKIGVKDVGEKVTLTFYDGQTETFTVSGILKGGDTAKQFPVFFSESYANGGSQLKDMPYEVYVKVHNAHQMDPEGCRELLYEIGRDAGIERQYISPSKAFLDSLSLDMQELMVYGLVGLVILLACILVIYGVFYLSVLGQVHQFGQLRTLGMTKRQIKKLVSREGGMLFLRSAPIGMILGGAVGYALVPDGCSVFHTLCVAAAVFALVYVITMISVRKPARIAAAVSPMEALRYVPETSMKQAANRKMCRRLTPLGLGVMNFSKNRKKAAITMASLGMGGILFMAAATYISSFDQANFARQGYFTDAEFNIYYSSSAKELNEHGLGGLQQEASLDEEMVQRIYDLDGVENVWEIMSLDVLFDYPRYDVFGSRDTDAIYPLTEMELADAENYLEEGSWDYGKLMSGDYILAAGNDVAEEVYGWRFQPGDEIILHYYDGSTMVDKNVTILGILNSKFTLKQKGLEGWFLMPEQAVRNLVSYDNLNCRLIVSVQEEKEASVGEALAELVAQKPELSMETLAERRISYEKNANQMFALITGLAAFIMAFSILSMINTLITNIVTRRQELAMLESIGMEKKQIRNMLLGESLLLVLAAVGVTMTVGTLCGYVLSKMLYDIGAFYMAFRFPVVFSIAYTGTLLIVPVIITLLLMHSFSKDGLMERLRGVQ